MNGSWRDWDSDKQRELLKRLKRIPTPDPRAKKEIVKARSVKLESFIERTTNFVLDPWQLHLCHLLESLANLSGVRALIHAPPQYGKSVIVSQRFPAWMFGQNPLERIKLACYNVTHAKSFGRTTRNLMQSVEYQEIFNNPDLDIPKISSAESFSTQARIYTNDSQPSFKALGLQTGFVGEGCDTLIIDDPYKDPQEAYSETINKKVQEF